MSRSFLIIAVAAVVGVIMPARAELLVAPTRVVLTPSTRSAELVLVNKGQDTAAFRLAIENRRMREDGSLEDAGEPLPGEAYADDKLRFSPRQVILEPGARQVVRIMATAPGDLAPGEYRSHLRLMSAPVSAGTSQTATNGDDANNLSIELIAIRSLTIPIVLRVGSLNATVEMVSAAMTDQGTEQLVIRMNRQGTRSTYGDIRLTIDGEKEPVWLVRGVAIYTPNASRNVILPLPPEIRSRISGRLVKIDYISSDSAEPAIAGTLLASIRAQL